MLVIEGDMMARSWTGIDLIIQRIACMGTCKYLMSNDGTN